LNGFLILFRKGDFDVPVIEIGRICVKLTGREAGKKCVIVDVIDKSFILITGPKTVTGVRRRRANINHVEPLREKITITHGASDEEITEALKAAGKLDEMAQPIKPALA
jgi:large subunit ribosomal protein L14e